MHGHKSTYVYRFDTQYLVFSDWLPRIKFTKSPVPTMWIVRYHWRINGRQGTKRIAGFKSHRFGCDFVSPSLSGVGVNESGRSPRVITSSNLDRNAGREFKLWKFSIHSYAKKSIQRLHDHWIRSKIKCQWIYIWYRAGLAEYIRVVMTYNLHSGRCNDILWDMIKWTSAYVPYRKIARLTRTEILTGWWGT